MLYLSSQQINVQFIDHRQLYKHFFLNYFCTQVSISDLRKPRNKRDFAWVFLNKLLGTSILNCVFFVWFCFVFQFPMYTRLSIHTRMSDEIIVLPTAFSN